FALNQAGIPPKDLDAVTEGLETLNLGTSVKGQQAFLAVNGYKPNDSEIRSTSVNSLVAHFAAIPSVRKFLFEYQREQVKVAQKKGFKGLVMEGRDIGSVIFPDAQFRFYLHADAETRSLRRKKQGQEDAIKQRDAIDTGRKDAPLKCPEGAIVIDTSENTLEQVIATLLQIIRNQD
ncbi:MAG: cytidylate kinase, partial [Opitutae bacterium]|nr:cytidylate kinase [Opitutae bacterium]